MSSTKHPSSAEWHTFSARVGGEALQIVSRAGFAGWDAILPAHELLAEAITATPETRVLILGAGHGALGVSFARRAAAKIVLGDIWEPALAAARRTLAANHVSNADVRDALELPDSAGDYDVVAIVAPPNRGLARRWLLAAQMALRPGGSLFLAGQNDEGIRAAIDDAAALFGDAALLTYRRRCRVAQARKGETSGAPAWATMPGIAPGTWHTFTIDVAGERYTIRSMAGIFSYDRLDDGTRMLLEAMPDPAGARVLDAGCGYGIIGLAAARRGARRVDLLDANTLAVAAARENCRAAGVSHAETLLSNGMAGVRGRTYDLALSNPPFHTGKEVDDRVARGFIDDTYDLLAPGGQLALVANRFLPYQSAMRARYGNVETLASTRGYHVLSTLKSRA